MNARIRTIGLVALLAALLLGLALPQPAAAAACTTVCYVDGTTGNDANDGDTAATAKKTIQAAVNQVSPGGQVIVAAGTYAQDVSVSKALTLTGAGPATTIIDPVNYVGISADNVTFKDIAMSNGTHGVRLSKTGSPLANTTFDNVHFKNNTNRGIDIVNLLHVVNLQVLNSLFEGNATAIRMPSNATADGITIDNTTFQNQTGSGFYQANDNNVGWVKNLTVKNSTFTNLGTSGSGHAGVYAEEFSNVLIENSTFTGNRYGINLFDAYSVAASVTTNVIIRGNTFTDHKASTIAFRSTTSDPNAQLALIEDNTINQNVSGAAGSFAAIAVTTSGTNANGAVDVVDNTITFSGALPVGAATMYGIYGTGGLEDVRIEGNIVDGGGVVNNGGTIPPSGVYFNTFSMKPAAVVLITKNELTGFVNGVSLHSGSAFGGVKSPDFDVIRNDLSGNSGYGIQSGPTVESDGTCNWWGNATGPSGEGPGSGTAVSTHVDYDPWLFTNDLNGACAAGGTITVVKQTTPDGDTADFEFDPSWGANFILSDGESKTSPPLPPATYSVAEVNLVAPWVMEDAECTNGNTTADPASIPVVAGEAWTCTFQNKQVTLCTTVCYADIANGNDTINGGTSPTDAFKTIQRAIDVVNVSGEVRVLSGTYPESPNIHKSLTMTGVNGRNSTIIDLQTGPTYLGSLTISGAVVTVQGFTIEGFDAVGAGLATSNVQLTNDPDDVLLKDNRIKVGQVGSGSNGDDGIGILTAYNTSSDVGLLRVEGTEFMPVNASAFRAFYINPGVDVFEFVNNTITGTFTASSYTQAKDGLVEGNTLTGTGTSRGLGTWGYPDPTVYGATLFQGNTISDVVNGISILGSENVTVKKNIFTGNDRAVYVAEDVAFDLSTIHINRNSIDGNTMGIENWYSTEVDGTCNWWGDSSGPGPVGPGSGDPVSANVDYTPWLYTSNLDGPCFVGGTISIDKVAPGGGATQFTFDVSWSANHVMLTDAAPPYVTAPPLQAGPYSITEINIPSDWTPQSATCDNTKTTPVETVNPSSITVADGDAWVCTFTNSYTPPPTNTCPVAAASHQWTDLLGTGMGSTKKHKTQAKITLPNPTNLVELYGQLVAKQMGQAKQVRFIQPGKNNYVEVSVITSPEDNINGTFWYGADLPITAATKSVTGKWWLLKGGAKNHIPRAFLLYATYNDPANNYVNVWDTYDAGEGEVYWDTAQGWAPIRTINVPIAAPLGATTMHVELALVDNDKDARPVWVTVTAGNVSQTVKPTNPSNGDLLNLLVFDLANVPAGTNQIVIQVYSPAPYDEPGVGALGGDSASLVGMTANYRCTAIAPTP